MRLLIPLGVLLASVALGAADVEPHHETWIVEGPWDSLPSGSTQDLRVDPESRGLTPTVSLTDFRLLFEPEPAKGPTVNAVAGLASYDGRLCLGYGDLLRNLGPVDALCLDPVAGTVASDLDDLPEEAVVGLTVAPFGTLVLAGEDARESHDFGNLFLRNVRGWTKRRTIPGGVHVRTIVPAGDRWYARYQARFPLPVDYPYLLVSGDRGASWSFERVDDGTASFVLPLDVDAAGEEVIAVLFVLDGSADRQRIYRFDGELWSRVTIEVADGDFMPQEGLAFGDGILIRGGAFDAQGKFVDSTHVVEGGVPREIPFLNDRFTPFFAASVNDGYLYLVEYPQGEFPLRPFTLHRTADLETWETLGEIGLLPGAGPIATAVSHGRLFVGARSFGGDPDPAAGYTVGQANVHPIDAASLHWSAELPAGSSVRLQVRTGKNNGELFSRPFVGPDGTTATFFAASGQSLSPIHDGDSLFQVSVEKTTAVGGDSPVVRWLALSDTQGTRTVAAERGQGVYGGRVTAGNGRYRSPIYRLGESVALGRVFVDAVTPGPGRVELRVRSGNGEDLSGQPFVGPDGSGATSYGPGETTLWDGHDGDRFLQFETVLVSPDDAFAPTLRQVAIETRDTGLAQLSVETRLDRGSDPEEARGWVAGVPDLVRVEAFDAAGRHVAVRGEVELTASNDLRPTGIRLAQSVGTARITIDHSGPTQICASLGDVTGCSGTVDVGPTDPAAFDLSVDLMSPIPGWSPAGSAGAPFRLRLVAIDGFGNPQPDYTGTVECRGWREFPVGSPLLEATLDAPAAGVLEADVTIDVPGELSVVCSDVGRPSIAGSVTVVMN